MWVYISATVVVGVGVGMRPEGLELSRSAGVSGNVGRSESPRLEWRSTIGRVPARGSSVAESLEMGLPGAKITSEEREGNSTTRLREICPCALPISTKTVSKIKEMILNGPSATGEIL